MENKFRDTQDVNSTPAIHHKNKIGLPLIALGLDLLPILVILPGIFVGKLSSFTLLFLALSPIAGLMMGVISLSQGKQRIGTVGKGIAIIAVTLPILLVALIVVFFIGAVTGVISFM